MKIEIKNDAETGKSWESHFCRCWLDFVPNLGPYWLDFRATLNCSTKQPQKLPTRRTNQGIEEANKRAKTQTPRAKWRFFAPLKGARTVKACNAHLLPGIWACFCKRKEGRTRSQHNLRHQLRSKSAFQSPGLRF